VSKQDGKPGIAAKFPGTCDRCYGPYAVGDRIIRHRGGYIHTRCASGADDR
jgi:hypothetical protein